MALALSLTRDQSSPVRNLKGFKKSFKVPDDAGPSNQSFIAQIATDEINEHLESVHGKLRQHFNFKRKELKVNEAVDGTGSISTPGFEYSVSVYLNPESPSQVVWHSEVNEISDPNELRNERFVSVFHEAFDTIRFVPAQPVDLEKFVDCIEEADDPRITLDYDMNVTSCEMKFEGIRGRIVLTSDALSLAQSQPGSPLELLDAFLDLHATLVANSDFSSMEMEAEN